MMTAIPPSLLPALLAVSVAVIAAQMVVLAWLLLCLWELRRELQRGKGGDADR